MAIRIIDRGRNNVVEAPREFLAGQTGAIVLSGDNNHVRIGQRNTAVNMLLRLGRNCRFECGDDNRLARIHAFAVGDTIFSIGSRTGFTADCSLFAHEPFDIRIGDRCLIADATLLTVSDMHSILSVETAERLNPGASITLADHVWLGLGCRVMKGVRIGADAVIGAGAVVVRDIPPNTVAAGVPAEVTRTGTTWTNTLR